MKYQKPQMNADERRLNVLFLDFRDVIFEVNKIFGAAFRKNREWHPNLSGKKGLDKNHYGIKQKLLAIINDKSRATNLRLSAFICGLEFDNTRQLYIISNVERLVFLFANHSKRVI